VWVPSLFLANLYILFSEEEPPLYTTQRGEGRGNKKIEGWKIDFMSRIT
jgi:hypothetical protein